MQKTANNSGAGSHGAHAHGAVKEIGRVVSVFSGVAKVQGLPEVFLDEVLVTREGAQVAVVIGFDEHFVHALFFDEHFPADEPLYRSFQRFQVPLSDKYIGRVVDGLGRPQDGFGDIPGEPGPVFRSAVPIIDRAQVTVPLSTGIKVIDACIPLGRGQRELILGDRKLGKSTVAIDTVLNQSRADKPVYCVYVLCGQKRENLRELATLFKKHNAFLYSTIVAATASSSFAEQYLAPFVGCAIAEHFRDAGKDALVIYDDLSKHAKAYRSISLILERAPGRETYPGDIFSLHAGLLERAAQMSAAKGGGSLTALPIVETQEDDITSYIPTNIISITDGQIYFGRDLFQKGFLPAVNTGLSVSRLGSQVQQPALAKAAKGIRLALAQHQELQKIARLETHVSAEAEREMNRGKLLLELLKQGVRVRVGWTEQVILFYAINQGLLDGVPESAVPDLNAFLALAPTRYRETIGRIKTTEFNDAVKAEIGTIIADFRRERLK